MPSSLADVDLIDELMFRCWARRNYLPAELRESDWHPVILDEMERRDRELQIREKRELQINRSVGNTYVPLVPTVTHFVHPAHSEIREPHFLSMPEASRSFQTDSIYAGGIYEY